jgi:hypothetical protein
MLMFAWAGRPGGGTAATATSGMHQASTMHADVVHLRMMVLLSFQGDQRQTLSARRQGAWACWKERN